MFSERTLTGDLAGVRDAYAPDALVLNCDRDFETLDPAVAEELLLLTETVDPLDYDADWVPADAPEELHEFVDAEFTVGLPGDGGVAWTTQTDPACVFVKPRLETSPDSFVDFLVAEALVEVSLEVPEQFLGFFGERYPEFSAAAAQRLDPAGTYQLAVALFDAYLGLQTRPVFADWEAEFPALHDAWADAGGRLDPRLSELSSELARGQTTFPAAAELACSAVKHGRDLPAPFAALDTDAYRRHGADYAVQWTRKTFDALE